MARAFLGSCFINDLGTVIALGVIFAPFTYKTVIFIGVSVIVLGLFPFVTSLLTRVYGNRTAAIRAKWVVLVLFSLGALAYWSGSEAVLQGLQEGFRQGPGKIYQADTRGGQEVTGIGREVSVRRAESSSASRRFVPSWAC